MSWTDSALHVAAGAAISAPCIPATLETPWCLLVAIPVTLGGLLREQAQFQADRYTARRGIEAWTKWVDKQALIEGCAWGVGALLLHLPVAIFG